MRIQNFYSLNRDPHALLSASTNMVVSGSTNRLHSGVECGGTGDVLVLIQISLRVSCLGKDHRVGNTLQSKKSKFIHTQLTALFSLTPY
jgi:hypothetical protein